MTVTTDRGKTFPVDWMWGPVGPEQALMLRLTDDPRPLSAIAPDLEGVARFHRASRSEGDLDFDGYTLLTGLTRQGPGGPVTACLARPEGG